MAEQYIESAVTDPETAEHLSRIAAVRDRLKAAGRVGDAAPKYFIQTFGCQQNEADSERLSGLCTAMGYVKTGRAEEAELILVNTCAVREHAEKKALSIIGGYKHIKDKNPAVIIGVGGCMVTQKARADKLKGSYPYVSFTFDTGAVDRVPALLDAALAGGRREFVLSEEWKISEGIPIRRESKHMAWLSIMYGCNNFCSYCIVPYVRGRERSRSAEAILDEARALIDDGARDITLLGQNVNSYDGGPYDGRRVDIADLMHRICALDGDFRLRFMTSHPKDASDRLIEAMATEEKVVKHFHLPVQAGSDEILSRMNRRYTAEKYLERAAKIRAAVPDVSLTSDIIVGFPGEREEDFEATLAMMRAARYDMVYSFIYSPRRGTPAASMPDQVPREVSSARMERLLRLGAEIADERNARFVGRTLRVLVEDVSKNEPEKLTARGDPVRPIHFAGPGDLIGQFVWVKITEAKTYCLEGELKDPE
ncbi:MAG: tRNA (N6-isopentenyl adenosine(37)-C2)-methylthiotransferase MiaB [Clostridia bacterium]|nr:tRNA (N6-isopentenyl adenosine(37)-C2)-methylthiotransferase MiaB [Clostridia bacterium]